jgi:hypothetical protein
MASEPSDDDFHDEVKTVTIRTFSSHDAANIARSNLEAHGIQCWINADDCGGWYTNLTAPGGVRLSVRASDAEAAIALLNVEASPAEIIQIETESDIPSPSENAPRKKLALGQIFIGIVVGVILCLFYQWNSERGTKTHYQYTEDGKADKAWIYRDGNLVEFREDRNLDGDWDHRDYFEHGQRVRSEYDNNFDGKPDEWWTYSDGGTDTVQIDTDFNGVPDEFGIYKNKIIQQLDIKPNGSKFTTTREIFKNGVLTEILRGGNSNGNFKEDVHYDPFFNPIPINFNPIRSNAPTAFQLLSPASK